MPSSGRANWAAALLTVLLAATAGAIQDDAYTTLADGALVFDGIQVTNGVAVCTDPRLDLDVADFDCSCTGSGTVCSLETTVLHFPSGCVDGASLCTTVDTNTLLDARDGRLQLPTGTTPVTCSTTNDADVYIDDAALIPGLSFQGYRVCDGTAKRTMRQAVNEVHTFVVRPGRPLSATTDDLAYIAAGMGRPFKLARVCCELDTGTATIQLKRRQPGETLATGANMLSANLACSTDAQVSGTPGNGCTTTFVAAEQLVTAGDKVGLDVVTVGSSVAELRISYEAQY